jgi:sRNA-binding regulator protein Hfq
MSQGKLSTPPPRQQANNTAAPTAPAGEKADLHGVQGAFLQRHLDKAVRVRLLDGKILPGKLVSFDTYRPLVVAEGGPSLIFKQAVAYVTDVPSENGTAAR